jgi:hypothetical protein
MGFVLITLLFCLIVGSLPVWSYSREWGYFPASGMALVLFVVMVFMLLGLVPVF